MNTAQIIATIGSLVGAVFASTGFWNWLSEKRHKMTASEQMILALAHDRIYGLCTKFLKNGEIKRSDYTNLRHLVEPYLKMGWNGTAKKLWDEVDSLPIVEE